MPLEQRTGIFLRFGERQKLFDLVKSDAWFRSTCVTLPWEVSVPGPHYFDPFRQVHTTHVRRAQPMRLVDAALFLAAAARRFFSHLKDGKFQR
jgi:hypothetical protein